MRHQTTVLILLFFLIAGTVHSQIGPEYREMFLEAESYFLFEEYLEALPYYEPINKQYPDNDNINFKMGVCYLNDPYRKSESIRYLEKASLNVNLKFKENSFKETQAPLESFFYLGNAYRINGELDKAIETYELFKSQADPELYDLDLVDEQITACENAKELQKRPIDLEMQNLGDRINTRFSDMYPIISGDQSKIVYIQKQPFYDAVAYCEKMEDGWSFPRILMEELNVDEDAYPTAMNYAGDEMILYRSDNFIGDLYTSKLVDGFWTPLVRMNDNINTKYWESHGCFSITSDTLYFTSNRKGTLGGLDIYYSIKGQDGEWGIPVNLGPTINTRYNEETPFITSDGKTLYFSSYGHYNMGGYDVFYSTLLENGKWSVPINAGYPINTTDDDVFFLPVMNGKYAYFPRQMDGGFGLTDIYLYEIFSETHPRKFQVNGILGIKTVQKLTLPVRILVIEQFSRDTVAFALADQKGNFTFEAPAGKYELLVEGDEIETSTTSFVIPQGYAEKELALKQAILLTQARHLTELFWNQDGLAISDTLILVNIGDTLEIYLSIGGEANLFVDVEQNGNVVKQDTFPVEKQDFTYSYVPKPGDNILTFRAINEDQNLSQREVRIVYTPVVTASDVLTSQETGSQTATADPELQEYLNRLTENSSGELKTFLIGVDLAALGIVTADQLNKYLLEQSSTQAYSADEIKQLLAITPVDEMSAAESLQENLAIVAEGELLEVLMGLDLEKEGISSEEELVFWLRDHVDEYNYTRQDVNDLILANMQAEYLGAYRDQLLNISDNESLNKALSEMNLSGIGSLQEFYEHLLSEADNYNYEPEDVNRLFLLLSQREKMNDLQESLKEISSGDLHAVLAGLDTEKENINNSVELISYLMDQADNNEYTREDAVLLLLDYLETDDLRDMVKLLIGTSSGDLTNLLLSLNLEQNNIQNLDDLYSFLLEQAKFYDYSEEDVIKLFLNLLRILEYEPIIDEIKLPSVTEDVKKHGKGWIFIIPGGIGLFILFYFLRRKKPEKEVDTK